MAMFERSSTEENLHKAFHQDRYRDRQRSNERLLLLHEKGLKVTVMARPEHRAMIVLRGLLIESLSGRFRRPSPNGNR
jgi:hypothetical protein